MHFELSITILLGFVANTGVNAHGHVISPRSRNYVASQDGKWWGGTANDPKIETCPHCLNRGGICGRNTYNYNTPKNTFGNPMPVNIQGNFEQGQEYEFSAVLTAHHKGHFEYKACPIQPGEVPTQDCFDQYPLEFVQDVFYNAPPDPNYPERAYIPLSSHSTQKDGSSYLYKHRYKLPTNLSGDLVLIQWHYVTANSCRPEGYDNYDFPQGFEPGNLDPCGPLSSDGTGSPEQFWNCVEVSISSVTTPTDHPVITAAPTMSPTLPPSLPPVSPTTAPVTPPTTAPINPPTTPTLPPVLPTASPTKSPVQGVSCPTSYTGLIPANDCTEFYHCADGSLVSGVPIYCAEGLLYKTDEVCMCNFVFVL